MLIITIDDEPGPGLGAGESSNTGSQWSEVMGARAGHYGQTRNNGHRGRSLNTLSSLLDKTPDIDDGTGPDVSVMSSVASAT